MVPEIDLDRRQEQWIRIHEHVLGESSLCGLCPTVKLYWTYHNLLRSRQQRQSSSWHLVLSIIRQILVS